MIFVYAAWFRDSNMLPEDEDYEWPAVFEIEATTIQQAQMWGDFLSKRFESMNKNTFLWSEIGLPDDELFKGVRYASPRVKVNQNIAQCDALIGW